MLRVAAQIRSQSTRLVRTPYRAAPHPAVATNFYRCNSSSPSSREPKTTPSSSSLAQPITPPAPAQTKPPSSLPLDSPASYAYNKDLGRYIQDLATHSDAPDLMVSDPFLDPAEVHVFPPTKDIPHENKVIIRNDPPLFEGYDKLLEELGEAPEEVIKEHDDGSGFDLLPYNAREIKNLHRYTLKVRRIVQQTGKGKISRRACLSVVGNGDGLVGMGHSKHDDTPHAQEKSVIEAIRNMDYVERFENRTIWTELTTKFGSTRVILRPRPVGFGLRCNPYIHEILRAAGIKDCSAKVWGSRNPFNVIMATFRMLHAGNAPLAMGDGIGGKGRKMEKGVGMRSAGDVERERGRKLACLRTV